MNKIASKSVHESFSRFFEGPTRESLREFLKDNVGELKNCDFKEKWPDLAAVAKHLLGIANVGGGCLIIGVKEGEGGTLEPVGIAELKDKADVVSGIRGFLPEPLLNTVEIADFSYSAAEYPTLTGKRFQVIFVSTEPELLPFVAQRSGLSIRSGAIYIRKEGATEEANYDEVQRVLRQRVSSSAQLQKVSTLKEHLEELKVLYDQIPRAIQTGASPMASASWVKDIAKIASLFVGEYERNPAYPAEDYQAFVLRVVDGKKRVIEKFLGLPK
ncbi:putative HTH transcriptional regulator [Variovorax boronicumulans]|uniref:HTH transcriptional regulator n=1 Tax=Variovorax boronicumulans TaxID=436515 RepID=A0AAW8CRT2_9BURK|nr:RNA-binding domain-containing protein [Variovorax boronicumulans]MDP9891263.1 putative HTH transcriptional regulator [Variovorax boronicumulans]MDQ0051331.1 putative HTH transcriptional regulator [Variovorax boronicumulans]